MPTATAVAGDGAGPPGGEEKGSQARWTLLPHKAYRNLYAVDFLDAKTGWAVGDYLLIDRTDDGGASWRP